MIFMDNLNLDLSVNLSDLDKTIDKQQYSAKLIKLVTPILRVAHNNYEKQKIRLTHDRINFACPYCGDSVHNYYKKRGNIILEGKHKNFYKCFNCGIFKRIDYFLKDFKTDMDLDIVNYIASTKSDTFESTIGNYNASVLLDVNTIEKFAIERELFKKEFNLIEIKNSNIEKWLNSRFQFKKEYFLYNEEEKYVAILNLTPSGKILGFQKRLFKKDNKYLTYTISKIYELLKINKKIPDEINSISTFFGVLHINFNEPITAFEGPFDSFLFKNSIAITGATKEIPINMPLRYWYDDDTIGTKKSIEKINQNESVFLWNRLKSDLSLPYRKKWDLNDVIKWLKENNLSVPNFNNYFSNDPLDIIDL